MIHLYGWAVKSIMLIIIRIVTIKTTSKPNHSLSHWWQVQKEYGAVCNGFKLLNFGDVRVLEMPYFKTKRKFMNVILCTRQGALRVYCYILHTKIILPTYCKQTLIRDISHQRSKICERNGSRNFPLKKFSQERIYFKYLSTICWLITYLI